MSAMNLIAFTRAALGLSQAEFGVWLAERLGRDRPIPQPRVAEWERGERSPRRSVRRACAPIAARAVAEMATEDKRRREEIAATIKDLIA